MSYCYVKALPKEPSWISRYWKVFPAFLLSMGAVLLLNVIVPIGYYQIKSLAYTRQNLVSPLSSQQNLVLGEKQAVDLSDPQAWFPTAPRLKPRASKITHYSLSIPDLKIEDAVVEVGSEDLMKSLVHYSGTALPGQYGNTVVIGHSTLVQFFNPENYKSIFSTLPRLEKGDQIIIEFDGITYDYRVIEKIEVAPEEIGVLAQQYDNRYLSLITCVPPGTYWRRLVVKAVLM